MRNLAIAVLVVGLFATASARADIPPQPGDQERYLLSVIEGAGKTCGKVGSFKSAAGKEADEYADKGLDAFIATCTNGKTYLVAVPRRRPGPPRLDPSGKPVPYPDPVVKEITR